MDCAARFGRLKLLQRLKNFLWKALSNALGVAEECIARGMKVDPRCQKCGEEGESINHVLFTCPAARLVWRIQVSLSLEEALSTALYMKITAI